MKYSILLMLGATPKWWVMNKDYRINMFNQFLFPLLASYSDQIKFRVYNSEAFHAEISDFIILETINMENYYHFIKELKATKLFTGEYFAFNNIVLGAENGFKDFNQQTIEKKELLMN